MCKCFILYRIAIEVFRDTMANVFKIGSMVDQVMMWFWTRQRDTSLIDQYNSDSLITLISCLMDRFNQLLLQVNLTPSQI